MMDTAAAVGESCRLTCSLSTSRHRYLPCTVVLLETAPSGANVDWQWSRKGAIKVVVAVLCEQHFQTELQCKVEPPTESNSS